MPMNSIFSGAYPASADMRETFGEACEQARVADELGYTYLLKGQHYFVHTRCRPNCAVPIAHHGRSAAEARHWHRPTATSQPLDAEQLASIDVMSGGRLVFGSGIGYRDVELFRHRSKGPRSAFEECLMRPAPLDGRICYFKGSHFELTRILLRDAGAEADATAVDRYCVDEAAPPGWRIPGSLTRINAWIRLSVSSVLYRKP